MVKTLVRRDFHKLASAGAGALAMNPGTSLIAAGSTEAAAATTVAANTPVGAFATNIFALNNFDAFAKSHVSSLLIDVLPKIIKLGFKRFTEAERKASLEEDIAQLCQEAINDFLSGFDQAARKIAVGQNGKEITELNALKHFYDQMRELKMNPSDIAIKIRDDGHPILSEVGLGSSHLFEGLEDKISRGKLDFKELLTALGASESLIAATPRLGLRLVSFDEFTKRYKEVRVDEIRRSFHQESSSIVREEEIIKEQEKSEKLFSEDSRNVFMARLTGKPARATMLDKRFGWKGYEE